MFEFFNNIKTSEVIATIFGAIIGWSINQIKAFYEIKKLEREIDVLTITALKNLNDYEEKRREIAKKINLLLQQIYNSLQSEDFTNVQKLRNELREEYLINYFGIFYNYFQAAQIVHKNGIEIFINEDVLPFLFFSRNVIETLNLEIFTEKAGLSKTSLQIEDIGSIFRYIYGNYRILNSETKKKIDENGNYFGFNKSTFKRVKWYKRN